MRRSPISYGITRRLTIMFSPPLEGEVAGRRPAGGVTALKGARRCGSAAHPTTDFDFRKFVNAAGHLRRERGQEWVLDRGRDASYLASLPRSRVNLYRSTMPAQCRLSFDSGPIVALRRTYPRGHEQTLRRRPSGLYSRSQTFIWIYSARRRPLEGYTDIREGLPSDAAFSQRMASIEGKLEFDGKVRGAWKMQAGTEIGQVADDTTDRRAAGHNELGSLEYFGPRKLPTLKHGQSSNLQFVGENHVSPNLLHNRK